MTWKSAVHFLHAHMSFQALRLSVPGGILAVFWLVVFLGVFCLGEPAQLNNFGVSVMSAHT